MRINHNISAINTYRQYNINTQKASKSMEKLSSGLRINRAADDAAGLSISEKMRGEIALVSQRVRNTQDQISMYQTAEGALNEVSDMLVRMKELIKQRSNATYSDDDIEAINLELAELAKAIGVGEGVTVDDDIVIGEDENQVVIDNDDMNKGIISTTKFNGEYVFADTDLNDFEGVAELLTEQDDTAIEKIDEAIKTINKARAEFGAKQNRLEHEINNDNTYSENLQAAESRIRDVDMAEEMMEYTKNNILVQAAQSMLAQANYQPQGILQLLQ